jgi:hypothetical protein
MAITNGMYRARACGECVLGTSKNKGTPFLELYFMIVDGDNKGGRVRWQGYFSENTNERSIQSLQICGWNGDDLSEFADGALHGLDRNEVEIVVELEEYQDKEGNTKKSPRVQWVNRAGGFLNKDAAMNDDAARSFGERMRGLVIKSREKNPIKSDDSFKFGANAEEPSDAAEPPQKMPF